MVVKFADYWKEETGQYPARLLFDWRTTTYASLSQLTESPGCGSGHSFRFVRCFPYLVAGRGVAGTRRDSGNELRIVTHSENRITLEP